MRGAPSRSVSTVRCSAMQEYPAPPSATGLPGPPPASRFDTVPEPMMLPAPSGRVFAACAISSGKLKVMSTPASARPKGCPLIQTSSGRCSRAPSQAVPSSSGVTATGENAEEGLDCRKPKPLASSPGMRLRNDTSFTSITSRMRCAASAGDAPSGTSSVTTAISASRSRPHCGSRNGIPACGARNESAPPWYMSGSVQNEGGSSAPRARRTSSTWLT